MRRPGYLSSGHMKPRQLGEFGSTLGYFGKGSMNLPPSSPPPSGPIPPGYVQDPKCPTGQKTVTKPCSGDCDPGETENVCQSDPDYSRMQQAGSQASQAGPQPSQAGPQAPRASQSGSQSSAPPQTDTWAPPPPKASAEELAAMQSAFTQLQAQRDKTGKMVTMVPIIQNRYTGSPMPTTGRQEKSAPTDEEKIASIASEHETQKAISRASDISAPAAPAPRIEPTGPPVGPSSPPPAPPGGIMSWLQNALFGAPAPSLGGLGQVDEFSSFNTLILPVIVIIGIIYLFNTRKNEPALRQPRKRR